MQLSTFFLTPAAGVVFLRVGCNFVEMTAEQACDMRRVLDECIDFAVVASIDETNERLIS